MRVASVCLGFLLAFLGFVLGSALPSAAAATQKWASFAAYPGAKPLCSEHVHANGIEIAWQSYATTDAPDRVVAFYEKDQKTKSTAGDAGEKSIHAPARDDDLVSIIAADKADKLPHCATAPAADARTVIVVSSATRSK
jgi:hypothetical protein